MQVTGDSEKELTRPHTPIRCHATVWWKVGLLLCLFICRTRSMHHRTNNLIQILSQMRLFSINSISAPELSIFKLLLGGVMDLKLSMINFYSIYLSLHFNHLIFFTFYLYYISYIYPVLLRMFKGVSTSVYLQILSILLYNCYLN